MVEGFQPAYPAYRRQAQAGIQGFKGKKFI
jgi:hypothetical protein